MAVFYRTNAQSRVLEDALRRASIPYVIVGGVRFYERKEIKVALLDALRARRETTPLPAFLDVVLDLSGYRAELRGERSAEAEARRENLEELIAAVEDYGRGQED